MWADRLRKANSAARSFGRPSRRSRPSNRTISEVDAHLFLCCGHGWRDACKDEHRVGTPAKCCEEAEVEFWQVKPSSRCLAWQELGPDPVNPSTTYEWSTARLLLALYTKPLTAAPGEKRERHHIKHSFIDRCLGYLEISLKPVPFSTFPSPSPRPFQVDSLPTCPHCPPPHHY